MILPLDPPITVSAEAYNMVAGDWQPEARPVPAELTDEYQHATYPPQPTIAERMTGIPLSDRLDEVMRQRLADMFGAIV